MSTERCIKWDKDAIEFFESAENNSLVLDIVISHGCLSQTGEGFEELVNSINDANVKKKIKKVNILDTSYLYRHTIPVFSQHIDVSIPTIWFLNNQNSLKKLQVEFELNSWVDGIKNEAFKFWHKQIMKDFQGDENGDGIVQEFRDLIIADAAVAAHHEKGTMEECTKFLLEESAYVCANLKNVDLVYPVTFTPSFVYIIEKYAKIRQFKYKISKHAQHQIKNVQYDTRKLDKEVVSFMMYTVSNVNFYVIGKYGNYIYRNKEFVGITGRTANAEELDAKSWATCMEVMTTKGQKILEEQFNGSSYLSVKSPLVIDGKIEGVIGLAVNITDRKKAEELQIKNKEQETRIEEQKEFGAFTVQILHDITSPLSCLEFIVKSPDIPSKHHEVLKNVASSIRNIVEALQNKYREYEKKANSNQNGNILVALALDDILKNKKYEYKNTAIEFRYSFGESERFAFIECDQVSFERMISNLINNAVEACAKGSGIVDVSLQIEDAEDADESKGKGKGKSVCECGYEDGKQVKIIIKDNGNGMPKEIIEKITARSGNFASTKHSGNGLGLKQVLTTIDSYKGSLEIESSRPEEGSGTTFIIKFHLVECPKCIIKRLTLKKGDIVVVLDDDPSVFSILQELMKDHVKHCDKHHNKDHLEHHDYDNHLTLKFFTKSKDALNFIESFSDSEKERIFLLSDYELRGDDFNGLTVILQSGLKKDRAHILTGSHSDKDLQDMATSSNIKILLKQFLLYIPVVVE